MNRIVQIKIGGDAGKYTATVSRVMEKTKEIIKERDFHDKWMNLWYDMLYWKNRGFRIP